MQSANLILSFFLKKSNISFYIGKKMFGLKKGDISFREMEILKFWKENAIFEASLNKNKDRRLFSFYDGPPFATGLPHYGHLLAGTIKDVVPRYKTMKGFYVPRRFGWDCHGLPVENEIEKAKELCGHEYVKSFGIAGFNEECCKIVLRYTEEWKATVERMGRWVDFSKPYKTMDLSFMESIWWVFKQLYDKGLIYEGYKVMPYSYQLSTPLSNFEANLNYKEVDDPSLTVAFRLLDRPRTYFLVWTTTPWTLVSNLALAVGKEIDYVEIVKDSVHYILAKARLHSYFKEGEYQIKREFKGKELERLSYVPLFNYFIDRKKDGAFRVLLGDFVSLEDGTGIVHMAPAFGEVDFFACKEAGLEPVCPVDNMGRFTAEIGEYSGLLVKEADRKIIRKLKEEGKVFHHSQIRHRYPFCWRTDTPLIYKAVKTWFVAVEKFKDELVAANKKIYWMPEHIKEGRFGNWLENARDWAISRNRFWGTPIPIWRDQEGNIHVIGSVKELEVLTGKKVDNLHRQYIDKITFEKGGKTFTRIEEVFDCWFESGSMPYAQDHYPFENRSKVEGSFPADFIAEGLDQTRGWFYTLNVLSVALFGKPAFKSVVVNGIILAENGTKMSKRLKNYPEPKEVIDKFGADAIRLYMLSSGAVKAEDLCFSESKVELVLRQVLMPFWNSYLFLATYANIYSWKPKVEKAKADIDRWIISELNRLILEVEAAMDRYDLSGAVAPFIGFIDKLTNWYIRRSRSRFWADEDTADRREAFATLYNVLVTLCKVVAPFVPFISETIYQELLMPGMETSVHLCDYPAYDEKLRDEKLEHQMFFAQKTVSLGHALRKENKIKVRQPLKRAEVVASDKLVIDSLKRQKELIKDELNVKELDIYEDESRFVYLSIKPNFRVLGKKVGKDMVRVKELIENLSQQAIKALFNGRAIFIEVADRKFEISSEDVQIERKVKEGFAALNDEEVAIALDLELSQDLLKEGIAREIVNKVNTFRKELGLEITDRIILTLDTSDVVKEAFLVHENYIKNEVLAIQVVFEKCSGTEWDLNGHRTIAKIEKVC